MSPLEKLGLEVAAYQLLGSRTKAAMLCAFIMSNGRVLSVDTLAKVRPWLHQELTNPANAVKTRIHYLRDSMEDVGLGGSILTAQGGYVLPADLKQPIIDRLIEVAGL